MLVYLKLNSMNNGMECYSNIGGTDYVYTESLQNVMRQSQMSISVTMK